MTNQQKQLEFQADRIEAVLALHKVPAQVTGGTVTPRWVRFQVMPTAGAKISKIKGLSEEIAAALDAPSCRVSRHGAAVAIEVPRDDPQPVRLLPLYNQIKEDSTNPIPPVTAILGLDEDGAPLLIRLPSPDVAHILIAGTTGSGKTVLLQTMILSLAMTNTPPEGSGVDSGIAMILIDPKGTAFTPFTGLPHLARPIIREPGEAIEVLQSLTRLMEQRKSPTPRVIVVIDELGDLLMVGGKPTQHALTRLTQRGREAGIHIIAATQKPTRDVMGPLIKANFPVRLVAKVMSVEDARAAAGWGGTGAERLAGQGDILAIAEGRVTRFQAAHVSLAEIRQTVDNMPGSGRCSMPSRPSRVEINTSSPTVQLANALLTPPPTPGPDRDTILAKTLVDSALWDSRHQNGGNGDYRWGFPSAACQMLFGQAFEGNWFHKTKRIITLAETIDK